MPFYFFWRCPRDYLLKCARDYTFLFLVVSPGHCESFPAASLTIGKDSAIVALKYILY